MRTDSFAQQSSCLKAPKDEWNFKFRQLRAFATAPVDMRQIQASQKLRLTQSLRWDKIISVFSETINRLLLLMEWVAERRTHETQKKMKCSVFKVFLSPLYSVGRGVDNFLNFLLNLTSTLFAVEQGGNVNTQQNSTKKEKKIGIG